MPGFGINGDERGAKVDGKVLQMLQKGQEGIRQSLCQMSEWGVNTVYVSGKVSMKSVAWNVEEGPLTGSCPELIL